MFEGMFQDRLLVAVAGKLKGARCLESNDIRIDSGDGLSLFKGDQISVVNEFLKVFGKIPGVFGIHQIQKQKERLAKTKGDERKLLEAEIRGEEQKLKIESTVMELEKKTYKPYLCSTRSRMHATMVSRSFSSSGDRKFKSASVFKIRLIVSISFSLVIT